MREDLDTSIDSEKHLNFLLEKYNLKKYINYQSHFNDIISVCPELIKCFTVNKSSLSSEKINELLGEKFLTSRCRMSSFTINVIINKLKEKEKENESML